MSKYDYDYEEDYDFDYDYDYESSAVKKHAKRDKIKWIITAVALVLLTAGLIAMFVGIFGGKKVKEYKFEAETAILAGGCKIVEDGGVKFVGEFNYNSEIDHTITFNVYASEDAKATLYVRIAADALDRNVSDFMSVTVNGVNFPTAYSVVQGDPKGTRTWACWREVEIGDVSLKKGENTIVLKGTYTGTNVDYVKLTVERSVKLSSEPFKEEPAQTPETHNE